MTPRKGRPLAVVKEGDSAPAPKKRAPAKPRKRTVAHAATLSKKTLLITVRDKIAASMDDPRAHPRDVVAAAKQLMDVQAQIDALGPKKPGAGTPEAGAVVNTPNERWDESAI